MKCLKAGGYEKMNRYFQTMALLLYMQKHKSFVKINIYVNCLQPK